MSEQAEIQQAAATGAAAAVGAVAEQQEVEQRAEEAELAAVTSAEIAQVAAEASQMAAATATEAVNEAQVSQTAATIAVETAGAAQEEVTSLRSELSEVREGFGQLTSAVRSLLELQNTSKDSVVQEVKVDATPPDPTTDQGNKSGATVPEGSSDNAKKRHKFGRRQAV